MRIQIQWIGWFYRFCFALGWGLSAFAVAAQSLGLTAERSLRDGRVRIISAGQSNRVHLLEASTQLTNWIEIARLHDGPIAFSDQDSLNTPYRFFRIRTREKAPDDDGKNVVLFPDDVFANEPLSMPDPDGGVRWIKFALLLPEPKRVEFQDSSKYKFHYDFASRRIERFRGMTRAAFDAATLRSMNQQAVLGAILLPSQRQAEYGIQFVGQDVYPRERILEWFNIVREAVFASGPSAQAWYIPAFEQSQSAKANQNWFAERGVQVSSADRWATQNACYSDGWAFGRLKFIPGDQIQHAYLSGELTTVDILLTDLVPAEVPFVAGILTLAPATPNSHVAILARSFAIPFGWIADAPARARVQSLTNREVALRVGGTTCEMKVLDIDGEVPDSVREGLLSLKRPSPAAVAPKKLFGRISTNAVYLQPSDIQFFGGKAANYGVLQRAIPTNSLPAVAFSFDLWDQFLSQPLTSGRTLGQEIHDRLGGFKNPVDISKIVTALSGIRSLILNQAHFNPSQQAEILNVLTHSGFTPGRRLRIRSSTNVEDSNESTGAGLYSSFSGCVEDDLDGDTVGPSACEPTEREERGVFRAIQKVYASFYDDNPFLERLRLAIPEAQVGMALLVHHSFPDDEELANGVVTLHRTKIGTFIDYEAEFVTQLGAVSVTNPDGGAQPEIVDGSHYSFSTPGITVRQGSTLVPLGDNVMDWEKDYLALFNLIEKVAVAYEPYIPARPEFLLDMEFKKIAAGLVVKQVREVPLPDRSQSFQPYLLNEPMEWAIEQGEFGNVFGYHRLKSRWHLASLNARLDAASRSRPLHTNSSLEFLRGAERLALTNGLSNWLEASHSFEGERVIDEWSDGTGNQHRRWRLETTLPSLVYSPSPPILTLGDGFTTVQVTYLEPQPSVDYDGNLTITTTTNDFALLGVARTLTPTSLLQTRSLSNSVFSVNTEFYWPDPPKGTSAGYTAPLVAWHETRIHGLTQSPIVLHGWWSQTYHPFHHNFSEEFLFEPQLEDEVPEEQLAELRKANIRAIYAYWSDNSGTLMILGEDGKIRR